MNSLTTTWEDDDCNRLIEVLVEYQLDDSNEVVIENVTPISVTFKNETGELGRQLKVYTETGQRFLVKVIAKSQGADWAKDQVAASLAAAV